MEDMAACHVTLGPGLFHRPGGRDAPNGVLKDPPAHDAPLCNPAGAYFDGVG